MAGLDIFRPLRSKESDGGGSDDTNEAFLSCISNANSADRSPTKNREMEERQDSIKEEQTLKTTTEDADIYNDTLTKYGKEPMGILFDEEHDVGRRERSSGEVGTRTPLSIKKIGEYELIKTIGSGSTGKVKLAVHSVTKEQLAVKIISRNKIPLPNRKSSKETKESRERRIFREAAILNLIDHDHIVKLKDFLVTADYFFMFFEYVDGLQLLDYIISHRRLRESQARIFFRQILSAVDYCHRNSIVHRDLKIENILVDNTTGSIKLLDFGLSNFFNPGDCLQTFCGSLYFAAPELLCGTIYTGPEVDVWSLGVILYVLVTGHVPFDDKNLAALHEKIKACRLDIPGYLGEGLKELLRRMICRDPTARATMDDVICHPWVNQGFPQVPAYLAPERLPIEKVDDSVVAFLIDEFEMQYTAQEIKDILAKAALDWVSAFQHPVVSLYFLAKDKLFQDGHLRNVPVKLDSKERSRSFSNVTSPISTPSSSQQKLGTRKYSVPVSNPSTWRRSNSISSSSAVPPESDYLGIRSIYLKGIFSVNLTTNKSPMAIRNGILQYLMIHNIRYDDRRSYFICEHHPSFVRDNKDSVVGSIVFEIHIVRLAFVGMQGIQFRRIKGDINSYKNLVSQMVSAIKI